MNVNPLEVRIAAGDVHEKVFAVISQRSQDGAGEADYVEISQDTGEMLIEIWPEEGKPVTFRLDAFMEALTEAREKLLNYDPREAPIFKHLTADERKAIFGEDE